MLRASGCEPRIERSSRVDPLGAADVDVILSSAARVIVCRGRKIVEIAGGQARPDDLKGPTGKFRAPLLQVDDTLLVGFNQQALADLLGQRPSAARTRR
ncbi:MAG: hypothetical protein GY769_03780 [bacterium]|nr:hypothetical protein [bacterium]